MTLLLIGMRNCLSASDMALIVLSASSAPVAMKVAPNVSSATSAAERVRTWFSNRRIIVAAAFSTTQADSFSFAKVMHKVTAFAPFQALVLALVLRAIDFPAGLEHLLDRLGSTLTPLALVSVGYQLRLADIKGRVSALTMGLLFKLFLGPLLVTILLIKIIGTSGELTQVTIFEAAYGAADRGLIVAMEHKLDPPLVTLMVGIGIPLSFLTLPLWWYALQAI